MAMYTCVLQFKNLAYFWLPYFEKKSFAGFFSDNMGGGFWLFQKLWSFPRSRPWYSQNSTLLRAPRTRMVVDELIRLAVLKCMQSLHQNNASCVLFFLKKREHTISHEKTTPLSHSQVDRRWLTQNILLSVSFSALAKFIDGTRNDVAPWVVLKVTIMWALSLRRTTTKIRGGKLPPT